MTLKFEGTSAIASSSSRRLAHHEQEYHDTSSDNYLPSKDVDVSSILLLFGIFAFIMCMALLRVYCFELPRSRRRSITYQAGRRAFIRKNILKKTVLKGSKVSKPDIENATIFDQESYTMEHDDSVTSERKISEKTEVAEQERITPSPPTLRRQKTNLVLLDDDLEETTLACPICLNDYQENDIICWSNNPLCTHTFHIECIEPWLMKNVKCPCCRNEYLTKKIEQEEEDVVDEEQTAAATVADNTAPAAVATTNETRQDILHETRVSFFGLLRRELAERIRTRGGRTESSSVDESSPSRSDVSAARNTGVETMTASICSGTATHEGLIMDDDLEYAMMSSSRDVTTIVLGSS